MTSEYNPTSTSPWAQITSYIDKKYDVLGVYDLAYYDGQMDLLYSHLEKFKDHSFNNNEKLIFYHFETSFYVNGLSLQLYNFQLILNNLNIPRFACMMLTAHYGIDKEFKNLEDQYSCDSTRMQVWTSSYVQMLSTPCPTENLTSNNELIEYPFLCLNGTRRVHRIMLLCLLQELGVLEKGIVSYHFLSSNPKLEQNPKETNLVLPFPLLKAYPFSRINEYVLWNPYVREIFNKQSHQFIGHNFQHPLLSDYTTDCKIDNHFAKSFLYVVTETVFDYPHQFLTEKIFKGIINRRPFVIVGSVGTLKQLKVLGFRTFESIIDESYDQIADPSDRLIAITKIVESFCSYSINELQQLASSIEDVLEYNYNYYIKNYCKIDLLKKIKEL